MFTTIFLRAKLHGIHVTGADLHYEGSIALDPEHCRLAGIVPFEFVEIWNKTNGARLATYVIPGKPGSRCCVVNGAAARLCHAGDQLIIAAQVRLETSDVTTLEPVVLEFDKDNAVRKVTTYSVRQDSGGLYELVAKANKPRRSPGGGRARRAG
jgi:aspartate 1-decarboxylase